MNDFEFPREYIIEKLAFEKCEFNIVQKEHITYNIQQSKYDLICIMYLKKDNDVAADYVSVYKKLNDTHIMNRGKDTSTLQLVFTINIKNKIRQYGGVHALHKCYVCTTSSPNIYALYCITEYEYKYNIVMFITLDKNNHPKITKTLTSYAKFIRRRNNVIACGSTIYFIAFKSPDTIDNYYENENKENRDYIVLYVSMNEIYKYYYWFKPTILFTFSGLPPFDINMPLNNTSTPNTLCIRNVCSDFVDTTLSTYTINTINNTIATQIITYTNINLLRSKAFIFDSLGNCIVCYLECINGYKIPMFVYITAVNNIRTPIKLLSVYISTIYAIKFVTDDIVAIYSSWPYDTERHVTTTLYNFNNITYTLKPLYIVNLPYFCIFTGFSACLNINKSYMVSNIQGTITAYNIKQITNRELIYTMLYEYLPIELCDMVWDYMAAYRLPYNLDKTLNIPDLWIIRLNGLFNGL